ncbi:MAG TPA: hypothetical protein VNK04_06630 [Gemmataceae bacterium]|nr:hypothetical protein [Gemmataceae bacterium]
MRRLLIGLLAATLALAGLMAWLPGIVKAADAPLAGTWKIIVLAGGQEITVWLVQIEDKGGKPQAAVLASLPNFKGTTVEDFRIEDKSIRLALKANDIPFAIVAYGKDDKAPKSLLGSVEVRGQREFIRLERTEAKELDPQKAVVTGPSQGELQKAFQIRDDKERGTALKALVQKYPDQPVGYVAAQQVAALAARANAEADARAYAEQALRIAALYGPEAKREAALQLARALAPSDKLAALQLDYARQAAQLLRDDDSAGVRLAVLKTLAAALRKTGKGDEVKPLEERIAKLDEQLDQEFLKTAIPFKPEPYAGRKSKGGRVAVLELFTGAQCPPCVAADVAFDALLQTYPPADVVLLQYHLHIPGPDPLTNRDTEKRSEFYGVQGTPTVFLDGKEGPPVGGGRQHAKDRYDTLRKQLDERLEAAPQAGLRLTADRKGDKIDIQAEVADLKKTGDHIRLRFVLIEDVVRYPGRNGQRLHHHVVRAFPGGVDGIPLKEQSGKHHVSISVAEVRKALSDYLADYAKNQGFLDDERPLELKHLKVAALVQDNASKEILQAAQVALQE